MLSSQQAAEVIGVADETIRRYIERGLLPARRQGVKGIIRIEPGDLRAFAAKYDYPFDEALAAQYSQ